MRVLPPTTDVRVSYPTGGWRPSTSRQSSQMMLRLPVWAALLPRGERGERWRRVTRMIPEQHPGQRQPPPSRKRQVRFVGADDGGAAVRRMDCCLRHSRHTMLCIDVKTDELAPIQHGRGSRPSNRSPGAALPGSQLRGRRRGVRGGRSTGLARPPPAAAPLAPIERSRLEAAPRRSRAHECWQVLPVSGTTEWRELMDERWERPPRQRSCQRTRRERCRRSVMTRRGPIERGNTVEVAPEKGVLSRRWFVVGR